MFVLADFAFAQSASYVNLNDDAAFSRNIDQSKEVGIISGSAGVTASGAATYSIPIAVPPGTNAMAPQISLVYNSQIGNGVAGYGWGIAGLSSIKRVPKNIYNDDVASPVNLINNDALSLDGQRLIRFSGSDLATGAQYRTEVERFSKITKQGLGGFLVVTKDGISKEYGQTSDSRVMNSNNTVILEWKLNRIYDNFGNYIDFKYSNVFSGSLIIAQHHLTEINYTGNFNAHLNPYNKILFSYGIRDDKNINYQGGTGLNESLLLDKITVRGEGDALYKLYQLNYAKDGLYSVLNDVVETGADNKQLNSTIFKYGTPTSNFESQEDLDFQNSLQNLDSFHLCFPADYNGDGFTDVLVSTYKYGNNHYNNDFKIYKHNPVTNRFELGANGIFSGNFNIEKPEDMGRLRSFVGFAPSAYI